MPKRLDAKIKEGEDTSGPWQPPLKIKRRSLDATGQRVRLWLFSTFVIAAGAILVTLWTPVGAGVLAVGIAGFVAYLLE